ncbi:lytic transglycosylase domain-containing protein [Frigidibacter sp. MR17.24]|uniref:lytic transglycosylase domain-containing protein n=1 Tax=Frigidibacter sp. MR17.24 TaxID=3127345 RepID=UPI00301300E6
MTIATAMAVLWRIFHAIITRRSRLRPAGRALAALAVLAPTAAPATAADPAATSALCDRAAATAARETGVPLDVLRAIALTETGRKSDGSFRAWPWTVNMEGAGHWFPDRESALAYVARERARGARSFDIGCFQINHLWHGKAFASVEQMFDPIAGARYAADFLAGLHAESGSWSRAAGAYHSRTPALAGRYAARFDRLRATLAGAPAPVELAALPAPEPPRRGIGPARPLVDPATAALRGVLLRAAAAPVVARDAGPGAGNGDGAGSGPERQPGAASLVPLGPGDGPRFIRLEGEPRT